MARYKNHIVLERRMSPNTVAGYLHDVERLAQYICAEYRVAPKWTTTAMTEAFMASLYDLGVEKTTQARTLSGIKSFFNFLLLEGVVTASPAEFLEGPKTGRRLPEVLTISEIDAILATFDTGSELGLRNAAMVETMYSCGLRVSELTGLRLGDIFFDDGFVRVVGKGDRQRLVPFSDAARQRISEWLSVRFAFSGTAGATSKSGAGGKSDAIFINRRGGPLSRVMVFMILKDAVAEMEEENRLLQDTVLELQGQLEQARRELEEYIVTFDKDSNIVTLPKRASGY